MSKQRGSFFGLASKVMMLVSMLRWQGEQDKKENQEYGSPMFAPKRKKLKGYERPTGRRKNFHKFKQH